MLQRRSIPRRAGGRETFGKYVAPPSVGYPPSLRGGRHFGSANELQGPNVSSSALSSRRCLLPGHALFAKRRRPPTWSPGEQRWSLNRRAHYMVRETRPLIGRPYPESHCVAVINVRLRVVRNSA